MNKLWLLVVLFLLISGCATKATRTNDLFPGMTQAEVRDVLGSPKQTEFVADKWVWKYSLHQPWVGFIPYYLVFDKQSRELDSWYADDDEYYRQQKLWLEAMPPTQRVEVEADIELDATIKNR